jgi:hypothetical protein
MPAAEAVEPLAGETKVMGRGGDAGEDGGQRTDQIVPPRRRTGQT